MAFDPEFLEMMPLVCVLKPVSVKSAFGDVTYNDGAAIMPHCHVQFTGREIHQADGTTRIEEGVVYLDGSYTIDTTWGLWVPMPGADNQQVTIQSIEQNTDEDGWHHTAVHFGAL